MIHQMFTGGLGALVLGALAISTIHGAIPSHWLAFAVVGRSQGWSPKRATAVTALAGGGHVLVTVALGLSIAALGKAVVLRAIPHSVEHSIMAAALCALGICFAVPAIRHRMGGCAHGTDAAPGPLQKRLARFGSGPSVVGALVLGMTLSPCIDLLSVYVAGAALSWAALALISVVMSVTTLVIMLALVWLAMHGLAALRLRWLERNDGLAVGAVLVALGLLLLIAP